MLRRLAVVVALCCSGVADAAPLYGMSVLAASNVPTLDPIVVGAPSPWIDVYHVVVENPNSVPVTETFLSLPRSSHYFNTWGVKYKASTELPTLGPNKVAETFFVARDPDLGCSCVPVGDTDDLLAGRLYPPVGDTLIPAGGSSILAVLSVFAGSPAPTRLNWIGNATINGVVEPILFVPEPTSGVLAGLALVGAAARRRV